MMIPREVRRGSRRFDLWGAERDVDGGVGSRRIAMVHLVSRLTTTPTIRHGESSGAAAYCERAGSR
jgi:hypothetical protein